MIRTGKVVAVHDGQIDVEFSRPEACAKCGMCAEGHAQCHQITLPGQALDLLQKGQGVDGLDEIHPAHKILHLVALQSPDEVEGRALVGPLGVLFQQLLDPVLPQGGEAAGNGSPAGGGVVHLAGAHQQDVFGLSPGALRRGGNAGPDGGNILSNGHGSAPFSDTLS